MADKIDNPKLVAIRNIQSQVDISQSNLKYWSPTSSASTDATTIDDGLTEDVWTSPVADDYRTKISTAVSDTDAALASIAADLTSSENAIINDGLEKVDPDSEEAKWPNK